MTKAKSHFASLVKVAIEGQAQLVTRGGTAAVVVVAEDAFEPKDALVPEARGSFIDHLLAFPGGDFPRAPAQLRDVDLT